MISEGDGVEIINLKKDQILFLAGEKDTDMFIINKGKVLIFVQSGTQIIPIAYLESGEYIGELSYFEGKPRSASILCTENCEFMKISTDELDRHLAPWIKTIGEHLARKIRWSDELIRSKGIRKKNVETIKPLSIPEQSKILQSVEKYQNDKK